MRDVRIETVYPHPPELVWRAISTRELLARWLMPNDFVPEAGREFEFRTQPAPGFDGIVRCRVLELDPPRVLSFTWAGGSLDTVVRFELEPCAGGTRVLFTHAGFAGLKGLMLGVMLGNGWRGMFARKLPRVLADPDAAASGAAPASCDGETTRLWRMFNRLFRRTATPRPADTMR